MKYKFDLRFWAGIGISLFFMILLFRKMDFKQLADALKTMDYSYLLPALFLTFGSYFLRAIRWRFLLVKEKIIPISSLYSATIIGYMANNILPARLGEFIRAYTLAEKEKLAIPSVFASLVIDRLFDGFTVLAMLLLTLFIMEFPAGMQDAETAIRIGGVVTFVFYCVVIGLLLILKHRTESTFIIVNKLMTPFPERITERLTNIMNSFIGGIRLTTRVPHILAIIGSSILVWTFCVIPVDLILKSFSIHLPITASMFIMVLLVFAVMVPASPGYIGTYHYACFKGLSVFNVPETAALSIALIMHAMGFFPVIAAGFYYLWKNRLKLDKLASSAPE